MGRCVRVLGKRRLQIFMSHCRKKRSCTYTVQADFWAHGRNCLTKIRLFLAHDIIRCAMDEGFGLLFFCLLRCTCCAMLLYVNRYIGWSFMWRLVSDFLSLDWKFAKGATQWTIRWFHKRRHLKQKWRHSRHHQWNARETPKGHFAFQGSIEDEFNFMIFYFYFYRD